MTDRYEELRQAAIKFHREHPEVWHLFDLYTWDRIDRGCKNYSARGVFHRIRWETSTPSYTLGKEFKLNNNHSPFYARAWMKLHPEYDGFYRVREQISKE